jgi:hypothetical protein
MPCAGGVGQQGDERQHLQERARPAVGEHERDRRPRRGAHVNEVDPRPAQLGAKMRQPVELRLPRAPVEPVCPVGQLRTQVAARHPLRPPDSLQLVRPASSGDPLTQIAENLATNRDLEGLDPHTGRRRYRHPRVPTPQQPGSAPGPPTGDASSSRVTVSHKPRRARPPIRPALGPGRERAARDSRPLLVDAKRRHRQRPDRRLGTGSDSQPIEPLERKRRPCEWPHRPSHQHRWVVVAGDAVEVRRCDSRWSGGRASTRRHPRTQTATGSIRSRSRPPENSETATGRLFRCLPRRSERQTAKTRDGS